MTPARFIIAALALIAVAAAAPARAERRWEVTFEARIVPTEGAAHVTAVDVGYGQMVWRLVQDARVRVIDRTNFRTIDTDSLDGPFDLVVVDVSFISVALLADNLVAAGRPGTRYVILVKPQFEVGRERVGAGGIVTDLDARADAIIRVSASLASRGVACQGIMRSPITGAKGNVEFLLDGTLGEPRELEIARIQEVVGI